MAATPAKASDFLAPEQTAALRTQAEQAARVLGVRRVTVHDLPDNRFDTVALLDVVKLVERAVVASQAAVILTHTGADLNVDHEITARAVVTAARPVPGAGVRAVYAFETPSSTEWAFGHGGAPSFRPSLFVDVTGHVDAKLAALACYTGEARAAPHPRSPDALRARAHTWGSVAGVTAAEAFEVVRVVG